MVLPTTCSAPIPCQTDLAMPPTASLPSNTQEPSTGYKHLQGAEPTQRGGPLSQACSRGCGRREGPSAERGWWRGQSLHACISLSSILAPQGEGQPAQAHNVPRFLGDSKSSTLIAPQEKQCPRGPVVVLSGPGEQSEEQEGVGGAGPVAIWAGTCLQIWCGPAL